MIILQSYNDLYVLVLSVLGCILVGRGYASTIASSFATVSFRQVLGLHLCRLNLYLVTLFFWWRILYTGIYVWDLRLFQYEQNLDSIIQYMHIQIYVLVRKIAAVNASYRIEFGRGLPSLI